MVFCDWAGSRSVCLSIGLLKRKGLAIVHQRSFVGGAVGEEVIYGFHEIFVETLYKRRNSTHFGAVKERCVLVNYLKIESSVKPAK
jgi:hypothetical protein